MSTTTVSNRNQTNLRPDQREPDPRALIVTPEAKAFTFVQELAAEVMNHGKSLARLARQLLETRTDNQEAFLKACEGQLRSWKKTCTENAIRCMGTAKEKEAKRIANSATTRVSQMMQIIKAYRGGLGQREIERQTKQKIEDLGFDTLTNLARIYLASQGEGNKRGRKAIAAVVKAVRYVNKMEATDEPADEKLEEFQAAILKLAQKMGIDWEETKGEEAPM